MPALGMAQETGRLVRWLKPEGAHVAQGEPLMEVETDKATVEIEAPATGTLSAVTAAEGEDVAVGHAIAWILAPGEKEAPRSGRAGGAPAAPLTPDAAAPAAAPAVSAAGAPAEVSAAQGVRPAASPKARRLAAERGLDLARLRGSGPGGAVLEDDVLQAGSAPTVESGVWHAMAENVTRSWREAPHFYVMREIDATALMERRRREPAEVTISDLLVRAVGLALSRHPRVNSSRREVNIGLAVALPDGLIVPVIHGADRLDVRQIAARRKELLEHVRAGRVRSADLTGATFTVSNLGMYGVDLFTAILTEGQAGILAVGRIADRVVARDGRPAVRPVMMLSLSSDHRRVDGVRAAEFMQTLVELLESSGQD